MSKKCCKNECRPCCEKKCCEKKCCEKKCCEKKCCCEKKPHCQSDCCYESNNGGCGEIFPGLGNGINPIIFLLIAYGSGLLGSNSSYLIILVFLLCGGDSISNLLGTC